MPPSPAPRTPEDPDHTTDPSPSVLELAPPVSDGDVVEEDSLTPQQRMAMDAVQRVLSQQNEQDEDDAKRRLEDETFLIKSAASRLTGLSLLSDPGDKRLLIAHHLREFFAALPLPPGLDAAQREALRREALTMLLKLSPQDDIERMLLMQLIASHMASMVCFVRMNAPGVSSQVSAEALGQAQKMSRLFLDIERAFRQRRKQLGLPARDDRRADLKVMADRILVFFRSEGIVFDDDDTPA